MTTLDNTATDAWIAELHDRIKRLEEARAGDREKFVDLEKLHQSVLDHNTLIENELEANNNRINAYLNNMRKYLSPQLYKQITGADVRVSLSHERRKLTLLFVNIVGFTATTDAVDPESLSDCLNRYLGEMSKIAVAHGGTIDKFVGDRIMIFFGAPDFESDKGHAERCVRMAIEMQGRVPAVNAYWRENGIPFELKIRIGINTGYCTVGNFGTEDRMAYTAIGSAVNIASLLEGAADPGKIVVAGSTQVLVDDIAATRPLGAVSLRGIHFPLDAYEVSGLREGKEMGNPFLRAEADGFQLKGVSYSKRATSPAEKAQLIEALKGALATLEAAR